MYNMVDVLLIYPPHYSGFKNPPLGLMYIAALLRGNGYTVKIIDVNMDGDVEKNMQQLPEDIKNIHPKWVGISAMTRQIKGAVKIAQMVKKVDPSIPVVAGGVHVSELPQEVLSVESIDFVVYGEGEMTMLDLINGKPPDTINGLGFKKNGEFVINPRRPLIEDLDTLPPPAWDLLPIKKIFKGNVSGNIGYSQNEMTGVILSSRGCPYRCIFCDSSSVFARRFRSRSAENVVYEIEMLRSEYSINHFDFVDDTITVEKERIFELCNLIIKKRLDVKWSCNARVNTINKDMLVKMKEGGCIRLDFGVESGDPVVLKNIGKNISLDQVKTAFQLCKEVGIKTLAFLMVGNLGEDMESIKKTLALAKEIDSDYYAYSITTPYPGTELYQIGIKNNWIKIHDWDKYVTGPGYYENYLPIMETDRMNQREILEAYYFLDAQLKSWRYHKKYGRRYFLNPMFYTDNLKSVKSFKDIRRKAMKASKFFLKTLSGVVSAHLGVTKCLIF